MEKNKSKNVLLAIMGVLIVAAIVLRLSYIQLSTFTGIIAILYLVLLALYGFKLYKIPHGNLLKYTILFFACGEMIKCAYQLKCYDLSYMYIATIVVCGIICYCAGRLDRIEQNKVLFPIIEVYFICFSIFLAFKCIDLGLSFVLGLFIQPITFATIMIAYFTRYKEHKEAGLTDAPKN